MLKSNSIGPIHTYLECLKGCEKLGLDLEVEVEAPRKFFFVYTRDKQLITSSNSINTIFRVLHGIIRFKKTGGFRKLAT